MKNLDEIIARFKELNKKFYGQYCSLEKCAHCPFTGNCLASEFDDMENDLIDIQASLSKLLVGQEGEENG